MNSFSCRELGSFDRLINGGISSHIVSIIEDEAKWSHSIDDSTTPPQRGRYPAI